MSVGGPAIQDVGNLHRVTILTANGWQIPRGFVEVKAGQPQTLKWIYRFSQGHYLNFHQDYRRRYYAPGFAPPSRPEGLDIGPCLPSDWEVVRGRVVYAGRSLDIRVRCRGDGYAVWVDGRQIEDGRYRPTAD